MDDRTRRDSDIISRRGLLKQLAGTAAAAAALGLSARKILAADLEAAKAPTDAPAASTGKLKGRIKQGACRGVFGRMSFEQMCETCAKLGLAGMDLVSPKDWPTLKKHGLICTMASAGVKAMNRKENRDQAVATLREVIERTAEAGFPSVLCLSGYRYGEPDSVGQANCIEVLKAVAPFAEEKKINVCMELLNSKVNHKGYQCDRTAFGAEIIRQVASPRVKLLYDIYHMQVQEGDVIATIRENIQHIAHFHTAGVPGRHEIDETQELYYPAIMRAIADLKFEGYVSHEYGPKKDAVESLTKAVALCDV